MSSSRGLGEWDFLSQCFPNPDGPVPKASRAEDVALAHMNHFLANRANSVSVAYSVSAARDCARTTSETLTREVIVNLNETHQRLAKVSARPFRDITKAYEEVERTNRQLLLTLGAIENTLTRDQGWCYQKLGEAIERTRRTLIVLNARLPSLQNAKETDSPLHFAGWRSLLANLASLENYRQLYGPRFTSDDVTDFLVFNATAPRSVNCGVRRMLGYLNQLPIEGPGIRTAQREIGKLAAVMQYDKEEIKAEHHTGKFLDSAMRALDRVHAALTATDQHL